MRKQGKPKRTSAAKTQAFPEGENGSCCGSEQAVRETGELWKLLWVRPFREAEGLLVMSVAALLIADISRINMQFWRTADNRFFGDLEAAQVRKTSDYAVQLFLLKQSQGLLGRNVPWLEGKFCPNHQGRVERPLALSDRLEKRRGRFPSEFKEAGGFGGSSPGEAVLEQHLDGSSPLLAFGQSWIGVQLGSGFFNADVRILRRAMCVRIPRGPVQQPLEDRIFTPTVSAVYSTALLGTRGRAAQGTGRWIGASQESSWGWGGKKSRLRPFANVAFSFLRQAPYPTGQNAAPTTLVHPQAPQAMSTQPQTRSPVRRQPLSAQHGLLQSQREARPLLASPLVRLLLAEESLLHYPLGEGGKRTQDSGPWSPAPLPPRPSPRGSRLCRDGAGEEEEDSSCGSGRRAGKERWPLFGWVAADRQAGLLKLKLRAGQGRAGQGRIE
ncbi:hypothetical protein L345_14141, partial [Ophiophagus hannah]